MKMLPNGITRIATISDDALYRYSLLRIWGHANLLSFVMLNPSTADASIDDPTIRRCMNFARREGHGGIQVVNLYALRSTDPSKLWIADNPIGPDNNLHIRKMAAHAFRIDMPIVCAWGGNASPSRSLNVLSMIRGEGAHTVCLGITKSGEPRHPLMVRADQPFIGYP